MAKDNKKNNKNASTKKSFFKEFRAEMKKVTWPTLKQVINNTTAVVVIVLIFAFIIFVLDFAFDNINKLGVERIKTVVSSSEESEESAEEGEETEATESEENTPSDEVTADAVEDASEGVSVEATPAAETTPDATTSETTDAGAETVQ